MKRLPPRKKTISTVCSADFAMMKKATVLRLVPTLLLLLALALCGCGKGNADGGETTDATQQVLELLADGKTQFVLIRAVGKHSKLDIRDGRRLNTALNALLDAEISFVSDTELSASEDRYELLLGCTDRPESQALSETLKYGDFYVGLCGKKLLLLGGSEEATGEAIDWFLDHILKGKSKGDSVMLHAADNYRYEKNCKIKTVLLGETSLLHCNIVIPEAKPITEYRVALALQAHLLRNAGYYCEIVTDATEPSACELVIGQTTREALSVAHNGYRIEQRGSRLYVAADNVFAYDLALEQLTGTVFSRTQEELRLENVSLTGTDEADRSARSGTYRILINNIYGGHQPQHPFAQRGEMLAELYRVYNPDIIGLQEFTDRAESIAARLTGYTMVQVNTQGVRNFVPLFYKADRFEVVASGYHRYTDGQNDNSKAVTWAVFRALDNGDVFAVASTHFSWKAEAGEARLTDAVQLSEVVAGIAAQYGCPVFFGGDFNCNMSSAPYRRVAESGAADTWRLAKTSVDLCTNHSYASYNEETQLYENPVKPSAAYAEAIDHIFLLGTDRVTVDRFLISTDLYALLSTDHTPLILDFSMEEG
ncbi:MAG TPA: hypothetical protein DDW30_01160 [Clostridiales bacterium]|nr:hypothetical protein [Clostridiales bacterium]